MVSRRLVACIAIATLQVGRLATALCSLPPVASLATLTGCELLVDDGMRVLASVDAGRDSSTDDVDPPAEAALPDAGRTDVGTGQDCSSTCVNQATLCQQTCAATETSCQSACRNGPCSSQCAEQGATCDTGCSDQCVGCFMQTMCAGPDACMK